MLKKVQILIIVILGFLSINGQNPFDVTTSKSSQEENKVEVTKEETSSNQNNIQESPELAEEPVLNTIGKDSVEPKETEAVQSANPFDITIVAADKIQPKNERKLNSRGSNDSKSTTAKKVIKPKTQDSPKSVSVLSKNKNRIWALSYCLLILGLLAFLVSYNRELISLMFTAILNSNTLRIVFRENYLISKWLFWVYYILFFLTIPFILYKFLIIKTTVSWPLLLLSTIAVLLLWYGIRHMSNFFFMHLTNENFDFSFYNYQIILTNIIISIILIPLVFTLAIGNDQLSEFVLTFAFGIIGLMYIYRQLRAMVMSSNLIARNTFHFFIYLCAVEIIPLLLIGKFITTL